MEQKFCERNADVNSWRMSENRMEQKMKILLTVLVIILILLCVVVFGIVCFLVKVAHEMQVGYKQLENKITREI